MAEMNCIALSGPKFRGCDTAKLFVSFRNSSTKPLSLVSAGVTPQGHQSPRQTTVVKSSGNCLAPLNTLFNPKKKPKKGTAHQRTGASAPPNAPPAMNTCVICGEKASKAVINSVGL